jgi:acetyltransferase-like isoleucine patch superfamily enzyme
MNKLIQKTFFFLRVKTLNKVASFFRVKYYTLQGMKIGNGTNLPSIKITWPHQVKIGKNCKLENNIQFKFDGIWKNGPNIIIENNVFLGNNVEFNVRKSVIIKNNCLIASGVKFIDHDHGTKKEELMNKQHGIEHLITLNEDVWIGSSAIILKGVTINKGAVVAASSVVTKSIPAYEIWGGIPAKKISERK